MRNIVSKEGLIEFISEMSAGTSRTAYIQDKIIDNKQIYQKCIIYKCYSEIEQKLEEK